MKMNKNTIDQLAAFITEDPSEFSPDLQVSGGPLDIMEGRKVLSTMQVGPNRDITYEVIVVDDVEGIMKLGEGTKWCFGGNNPRDTRNFAQTVAEKYGPFYFVLKDGEPFLAASEWAASNGWRNRDDVPVTRMSPALTMILQDAGVPESLLSVPTHYLDTLDHGLEEGLDKIPEPGGYKFRVYKHANGSYDAFANFKSLKDAVEYMRNWNSNQMHNWYIVDEDSGKRFQMNQQKQLVITRPGVEEGLARAGVLNEFLGGSENSGEFTVELTTTDARPGGFWVLFQGKEYKDLFETETLAVAAAKALGAEQVTVKPIPKKAQFVEPAQPLEVPEDFGAEEDRPLAEPFHNQARGGGAAGPDAGQYYGA